MELHEIIIKPTSGFATPLKGDTIFGHFCWQVTYHHDPPLLNGTYDNLDQCLRAHLKDYHNGNPFVIFSSAFPVLTESEGYALKKPDFPMFFDLDMDQYKLVKKARWIRISASSIDIPLVLKDFQPNDFYSDKEIMPHLSNQQITDSVLTHHIHTRNAINRKTGTTGTDMFAPRALECGYYAPEMKLVIFVLLDEAATDISRVTKAMKTIGKFGFGKYASTGMGCFDVIKTTPLALPDTTNANAIYTLAPVVPGADDSLEIWSSTFTRFGRHGDTLATGGKPFKKPVIMADEGAIIKISDSNLLNQPFFGTSVTHVSDYDDIPVTTQGYCPYLPVII